MIERNPSRQPPPPIEAGSPQYRIHISLSGDAKQKFFQNLAEAHDNSLDVTVPDNAPYPLPKFLEYTWTRMVDIKKPSEMSFWSFNSLGQRLSLRTLIVTGKTEQVQINGQSRQCWKCIDELDPGNTVILVDNDGRIMSMRTSDGTSFCRPPNWTCSGNGRRGLASNRETLPRESPGLRLRRIACEVPMSSFIRFILFVLVVGIVVNLPLWWWRIPTARNASRDEAGVRPQGFSNADQRHRRPPAPRRYRRGMAKVMPSGRSSKPRCWCAAIS